MSIQNKDQRNISRLFGKWRSRIIAWSIVLAMVVLFVVAFYVMMANRNAANELVIERNLQIVYLSTGQLREELERLSLVLDPHRRYKDFTSLNPDEQFDILHKFHKDIIVFDGGVVLLDNLGKVQVTHPDSPSIAGQDWSNKQLFRRAISSNNVVITEALPDEESGQWEVIISLPITGENGEFAGVIAGKFNLDRRTASSFYASIVRLRIGHRGNTYIVNRSGKIIFDSLLNRTGLAIQFPGLALEDFSNKLGASRFRDDEGKDKLITYALIPGTEWTLIIEEEWDQLTNSERQSINKLFILMILGMAMPAGGIFVLLRQHNREILENEHLEKEIELGRKLQMKLLPKQTPFLPGWEIYVRNYLTNSRGGDYYDYQFLNDGRLMMAAGRVKGNDISTILLLSTLRSVVRCAANSMVSPSETLRWINDQTLREGSSEKSVGSIYLILEPSSGLIQYASAGFTLVHLYTTGDLPDLRENKPALGENFNTIFAQEEIVINPGESLVYFSEGLVSTKNPKGEVFGSTRLVEILASHPGNGEELLDILVSSLRSFSGSIRDQETDSTLILLERLS